MTSLVVRSAKRFHQVLAVDAIEVGRVIVVPDSHLVRFRLCGNFIDGVGGLLQKITRLVNVRGQRTDDEVSIADRLIELHRRCKLVALQLVEPMMEPAGFELCRVEVFAPLRARLPERVLEFNRLEADCRERVQSTGNLGRELFSHTPELHPNRNALPRGASGGFAQRTEKNGSRCGAAEFQNVTS